MLSVGRPGSNEEGWPQPSYAEAKKYEATNTSYPWLSLEVSLRIVYFSLGKRLMNFSKPLDFLLMTNSTLFSLMN